MTTPRILLIGDLMIDRYLWGKCDRISPEAPVPVIDIERETTTLGGAGNVLYNLLTLGASVKVCSVIGDDAHGQELSGMIEKIGVDSSMIIRQTGRNTSNKTRVIASHQQVVRFDRETKTPVSPESETRLIQHVKSAIGDVDLILLSDYAKGVLTTQTTQDIITLGKERGLKVLVDPKGKDYKKYTGAYLITPNRKEAGESTGKTLNTMEDVKEAGISLKTKLNLDCAVITLSEEGMAVIRDDLHHIPTRAREVFDVTGAGDTVLASLGYSLATGYSMDEAAHFANTAAAVVVGKVGAATATLEEIEQYDQNYRNS